MFHLVNVINASIKCWNKQIKDVCVRGNREWDIIVDQEGVLKISRRRVTTKIASDQKGEGKMPNTKPVFVEYDPEMSHIS